MQTNSLAVLAGQQLDIARQAGSGRSAHTVHGGHDAVLRQTLIALAGGHGLDEHESPGEATLHVLQGHVRLITGSEIVDGTTDDLLVIPDARHALEAIEDSVVLLTVAKPHAPS
ncbi:cupin domain-containing protein [Actinoplanes utahensis]|uniref:LuxR family transcriptional regulator n=1 Tax=Actinoplanes utahensis TaxID=1869 RepID=A0A0A6ULE1_ACTUT|nr:cupin domain-containing protein [Actinoplanes utahensis]KHD76945.1 LuxR family transcriptional regulator [Actinoplanes utahensis]GIF27283.1 LuxR family transcriptional regulator [Actinoplanes utahensis]